MLFIIILLVVFVLILALDLGLSIGVAFLLTWLYPAISFATAVVIGAICSSFSIYFFVKLVVYAMDREMDGLERKIIIGEGYDEDFEGEEEYLISPALSPQRKRRGKRKH